MRRTWGTRARETATLTVEYSWYFTVPTVPCGLQKNPPPTLLCLALSYTAGMRRPGYPGPTLPNPLSTSIGRVPGSYFLHHFVLLQTCRSLQWLLRGYFASTFYGVVLVHKKCMETGRGWVRKEGARGSCFVLSDPVDLHPELQ